jgi:hypothetical protein
VFICSFNSESAKLAYANESPSSTSQRLFSASNKNLRALAPLLPDSKSFDLGKGSG